MRVVRGYVEDLDICFDFNTLETGDVGAALFGAGTGAGKGIGEVKTCLTLTPELFTFLARFSDFFSSCEGVAGRSLLKSTFIGLVECPYDRDFREGIAR
jgi:hypothetical protein